MKYLNDLPQCYAIKFSGDARRSGQPDILGSYHGKTLALEVKRPEPYGSPLTALQAKTLVKWRDAGAIADVVRSVDDVRRLLEGG